LGKGDGPKKKKRKKGDMQPKTIFSQIFPCKLKDNLLKYKDFLSHNKISYEKTRIPLFWTRISSPTIGCPISR
jgi:hypothetical protein